MDGKRCGWGTCKWADNASYEGRWKEGVRWGQGKFISNDGSVYEGEWVNDIREGEGKLTYRDTGKIVIGKWEKDRLNG